MTRARRRRTGDPQPGLEAAHADVCVVCHNNIERGDRIVFRRGRALHVTCHGGQDE